MNDEEKRLLEEILTLQKENNKVILSLKKSIRWTSFTRIFYWILIAGIAFGAFFYIKPYLGSFLSIYSGNISGVNITELTKSLMEYLPDLF
ncbi:MAG TPA: hypothetical protein PLH90_02105 [Candidatus Paceibacterota bacterium]|nr:hypothetical protein [Candidatus Paceibacterota bacterium]